MNEQTFSAGCARARDHRCIAGARAYVSGPPHRSDISGNDRSRGSVFSFYGMQALMVLYMVDTLLLPGHAEHVLALGGLRKIVQAVFGQLSTQGFASEIFGLYAGAGLFHAGIWWPDRRSTAGPAANRHAGRGADVHSDIF